MDAGNGGVSAFAGIEGKGSSHRAMAEPNGLLRESEDHVGHAELVEPRPFDRRRRLRADPLHPRKQDPAERLKNFDEVSYALTLREALLEASRCLQCEHHPCTFGCPAHNDIPGALWLLEQGFDAVFLGHGACATNRMKIPGEDLKNVYNATEYLVRANLPDELLPENLHGGPRTGRRTVVVGGCDTAMDCVRSARRLCPEGEVWCVYRRSEVEMPGRMEERINAREEGMKFEWLTLPVKFIGDAEGKVVACECIRMKLGKPDAKCRRTPVPIEGSNFVLECDTAVIAIGYSVDDEIAQTTQDLKTTKWGTIWVNSEDHGKTSREEEIWAAGDCVRGADLIVTAMAPARRAARSIDRALRARFSKAPSQDGLASSRRHAG